MSKIMVTGGSSGLGKELVRQLTETNHEVIVFDSEVGDDVRWPEDTRGECPPLDVLINCAGVNMTDWLEDVTDYAWSETMDVNAKGIFRMSQWALDSLRESKGTIVNIVSNASHMPMTTSLAYNASKGAAHIMTLQLARELTKRHGITVFGVSPNKLRGTKMSADIEAQVVRTRGWTPEFAAEYQRNALLTGMETEPSAVAEFIAFLLSSKERHVFLSGCILPYGA